MNLFKKKSYISIETPIKQKESSGVMPSIPDGMWVKCKHCGKTIYQKDISPYKLCPHCGHTFYMNAWERIQITCDENSFEEINGSLSPKNPMEYPDYEGIIKKAQEKSGLNEAVVTGTCRIMGSEAMLCIMDNSFMMGSMGSVVGEKITRAIETATKRCLPVIIFTTSGGARMQEGIISLMQMAKISAAVRRHSEKGLLYISVITDPTTGGVTASFAMQGDIILAEPKALIGFAGQRVIKGTINQELPEGFQTAEFQLEHGFIDKIVPRKNMRKVLGKLLKLHAKEEAIESE